MPRPPLGSGRWSPTTAGIAESASCFQICSSHYALELSMRQTPDDIWRPIRAAFLSTAFEALGPRTVEHKSDAQKHGLIYKSLSTFQHRSFEIPSWTKHVRRCLAIRRRMLASKRGQKVSRQACPRKPQFRVPAEYPILGQPPLPSVKPPG